VKARVAAVAVLCGVIAAGLSACGGGGPGMMTASAEFTDISSMAHHATVEMAGVSIGYVSHIAVDGAHARLTLRFPRSARVPASVVAQVRRAAVLGPEVVELVIPTGASLLPLLADKATITATEVRPDLEDLIKTGSDLLGAVDASQLAELLQEGATGVAGRGAELHQLIDNLDTVLTGYASRTAQVTALVKDLDTFASTVGPAAQADAEALTNLAQTTAELDQQRVRLTNLLAALNSLSVQGVELLATQLPQIGDQLVALQSLTQALAKQDAALGAVLTYFKGHNASTKEASVDNFLQVLNDFIICGVPGGGEDPTSPLNACTKVTPKGTP
jgi:phospholipid/cholesterol/gamma-HCH transport system substrate-binding protein